MAVGEGGVILLEGILLCYYCRRPQKHDLKVNHNIRDIRQVKPIEKEVNDAWK